MARFLAYNVVGVAPKMMEIGPVAALPDDALCKTGIELHELDWIRLNEAFAAQFIAMIDALGLDIEKSNPLGGAIAICHPLAATGAVRTTTLVHALQRHKRKYGLVTMCIGTGMRAAGVFENVN